MTLRRPLPLPSYEPADAAATPAAFIAFGDRAADALLSVGMRQLGEAAEVELWRMFERGKAFRDEGLTLVASGDYLLGAVHVDGDRVDAAAKDVYSRILRAIRKHGTPFLLRMWNHVGSINDDDDGLERYRRFCVGRYEAFHDAGYLMEADLPAASAVGMQGRDLQVYFLAARTAGVQVENPRQVAAYHYPPQYGPKSPSFSRATVYRRDDATIIYVSGTSSVVGHESVHTGDVLAQLEETLVNLNVVLGRAMAGASLANFVSVKTYVRNASDCAAIAQRLDAALPAACTKLYVESDICRRDLLLEIEGVAVL